MKSSLTNKPTPPQHNNLFVFDQAHIRKRSLSPHILQHNFSKPKISYTKNPQKNRDVTPYRKYGRITTTSKKQPQNKPQTKFQGELISSSSISNNALSSQVKPKQTNSPFYLMGAQRANYANNKKFSPGSVYMYSGSSNNNNINVSSKLNTMKKPIMNSFSNGTMSPSGNNNNVNSSSSNKGMKHKANGSNVNNGGVVIKTPQSKPSTKRSYSFITTKPRSNYNINNNNNNNNKKFNIFSSTKGFVKPQQRSVTPIPRSKFSLANFPVKKIQGGNGFGSFAKQVKMNSNNIANNNKSVQLSQKRPLIGSGMMFNHVPRGNHFKGMNIFKMGLNKSKSKSTVYTMNIDQEQRSVGSNNTSISGVLQKSGNECNENRKNIDNGAIENGELVIKSNVNNNNNNVYSNSKINVIEEENISGGTVIKRIRCMHEFSKTGYAGEDEKKINQDNYFVFHNFVNSSENIFMAVW